MKRLRKYENISNYNAVKKIRLELGKLIFEVDNTKSKRGYLICLKTPPILEITLNSKLSNHACDEHLVLPVHLYISQHSQNHFAEVK